jgi:salicylate hydroxylase
LNPAKIERDEMPSSYRIAIVGGGLAGLATARSLATVGIKADVFEQAPALGEIGAAVNVSPQAVKALRAIGLGDKIAAVGHSSPGIYTRNMLTGEFLEFNDRVKLAERFGAARISSGSPRVDQPSSTHSSVSCWVTIFTSLP